MEKQESKYCPACGSTFVCRVGDIANCQCSTVQVSNDLAGFLRKTSFQCLCAACLVRMDKAITHAQNYPFPTQKEMLVEGLHYYKEGGNWVFTELYHILRGHCCQSGCRHCVYGFGKE